MTFLNAWMLAGLATLTIPILIHLLLKSKKRRLRFSTVQFFMKQDEQSSRYRKLRHWFLLALRLLIVGLLVLAFARPYLRQLAGTGTGPERRQAIFVVDQSVSMLARARDGQRWARAKQELQKALAELKPEDRAALIGCGKRAEVVSGFAPPAVIARAVARLEPGYAATELGEGLARAVKLISTGDPNLATTIYLVSDLQRSGCQALTATSIPEGIAIVTLGSGDIVTPNLAVGQLELEPVDGAAPHVRVSNFSDEAVASVKLELSIDGKPAGSQSVQFPAGISTNIELALPSMKPGWHEVKVSVAAADALAVDDAVFASVWVPEPVRVWLVEPRKTRRAFEEASFFVSTALDPAKDSTNSVPTTYNLVKIGPEELVNRLATGRGERAGEWVILPGLATIPAASGTALAGFVQSGGGLLLFLGEGISLNRYQSEFRDLLPAQLGPVETAGDLADGWRLGQYDTNHWMFASFRRPGTGDLWIPRFTKRHRLTPVAGAARPALFEDDQPLIVTRNVGRGRVALVNTTADTTWNDWPKHKTFVPWLHGLGKFLARQETAATREKTNWVVGDEVDLELELATNAVARSFKLIGPTGVETALTAGADGRIPEIEPALPGIYSLRDAAGRDVRKWAVNIAARESDLEAMRVREVQSQLAHAREPAGTTLAATFFGPTRNQKELWRVLLLGVLVLLFLEMFMANRTTA